MDGMAGVPRFVSVVALFAQQRRRRGQLLLEVSLVTTKAADPAALTQWTFVGSGGAPSTLPSASEFVVHAGSAAVPVQSVAYKRRPIYAPLARYDLRVGNWLYLVLASPLADGTTVTVDDAARTQRAA
jgi:hypothetical protein